MSMKRIDPEILVHFERFSRVPLSKLHRLANAMSVSRFDRHERIYSRRERSRKLYLLLKGVARLSGVNRSGEFELTALISPGEMFGVSAVLPDNINRFQCDAYTECEVAIIDAQQFVNILLNTPLNDFQIVIGMLLSNMEQIFAINRAMFRLPVGDRLRTVLDYLAGKFGTPDARGTVVDLPVTHQDLADLVGATRPVITMQLRELERKGIVIKRRRRLFIAARKLI